MLDVAIAFLWPDGMMNHTIVDPEQVLPPVSRSFRLTPTADGQVSLVTLTATQWANLVEALSSGDHDPPTSRTRQSEWPPERPSCARSGRRLQR